MAYVLEIKHQLTPATPKTYEDFVLRYGELVIPLMEKCGWDVLGGWMWATGTLFSDFVLVQFDSLTDYAEAWERLESQAQGTGLSLLDDLGLSVRQDVSLSKMTPFSPPARIQAGLDRSAERAAANMPHRTFTYARLTTSLEHLKRVEELIELTAGGVPPTTQLIASYNSVTGRQAEMVDLWARDEGVPNFGFITGRQEDDPYEELYRLVETETVNYLNPLPYSRLR